MKFKYRPEIDSLRAIAVLLVIFYHAEIIFFKSGFIGVDIFIVISGYVITKLFFYKDFSFSYFIERRFRRLLPAIYFMILITTIFSYFFLLPTHFMNLGQSLVANIFFISNFLFFYQTNYWDFSVLTRPLLHTWSVSLEVQFYIFISLMFALFRNNFLKIILFFFISSIFLLLIMRDINFSINLREFSLNDYFLIFARLWEFLAGSIIAFVLNNKKYLNILNNIKFLQNFGLIIILISLILIESPNNYPNLLTLLPVLGTAIIILNLNSKDSHLILNNSFLLHIGKISYSLYLWHFPILIFFLYNFDFNLNIQNKIYALIITYFVSFLSYKFIELPFYKKNFFSKKYFYLLMIFTSITIISLGVLISDQVIKPKKYLQYTTIKKTFSHYNFSIIPKRELLDNQFTNSSKLKILICGDSHGFDLALALQSNDKIKEKYEIDFDTFGSCINDTTLKIKKSNYVLSSIQIEGKNYNTFEDIEKLYKIVTSKYNKKLVIVGATPEFQTDSDLLLNYLTLNNIGKNDLVKNIESINKFFFNNRKTYIEGINEKLFKISKNLNVIFLNKLDYICKSKNKICYGVDPNGNKNFFDYSHYTNNGATYFGNIIEKINWLKLD